MCQERWEYRSWGIKSALLSGSPWWAKWRLEQQKFFYLCNLSPQALGHQLIHTDYLKETKKPAQFQLSSLSKGKLKNKQRKNREKNLLALGTSSQMKMPGCEAILQKTIRSLSWKKRYPVVKNNNSERKPGKHTEFPLFRNGLLSGRSKKINHLGLRIHYAYNVLFYFSPYINCVFCHCLLACSSLQNRALKSQDRKKESLSLEVAAWCSAEAKGCVIMCAVRDLLRSPWSLPFLLPS